MILFLVGQGLSYLQVGTLYAVREILVNVMEIPSGAIADGLGRRRTIVASSSGHLVSFGFFWFGSGMTLFLVAMVFFSVGEAFRTGTHKAMIFAYLRLNGWQEYGNDYYGHTRSRSRRGDGKDQLALDRRKLPQRGKRAEGDGEASRSRAGGLSASSLASRNSAAIAGRFRTSQRALNWLLILGLGLGLVAGISRWQGRTVIPVVTFLTVYVLQNLRQPLGVSVVADRILEDVMATVLSAQSQLQSLFAAIVALLVGATADFAGGNVGLGLTLSAGMGVLLVPILRLSPRPTGGAADAGAKT